MNLTQTRIMLFMICVMLFIFSVASCNYVSTSSKAKYPIIKEVQRPKLPIITAEELAETGDTGKKLVKAIKDMQTYSKQLEAGIAEYNEWAKKENKKNGHN